MLGQAEPTLLDGGLVDRGQVSEGVAFHTLGILAANRYVRRQRPGSFAPYVVTWKATT